MHGMDEDVAVRRGRVRLGAWQRVGHGVHRRVDSAVSHPDLRAWLEVLPTSAVLSHLSAASAHGWWMPPLPTDLPVFVAMPRAAHRVRRPELVVTRHPTPPAVVAVDGLRVTPPAETLVTCARDLGVLDLAVLADAALRAGTTREEVVLAARRRRGAPRLLRALELADPRSESAWETLLRVLHPHPAGVRRRRPPRGRPVRRRPSARTPPRRARLAASARTSLTQWSRTTTARPPGLSSVTTRHGTRHHEAG